MVASQPNTRPEPRDVTRSILSNAHNKKKLPLRKSRSNKKGMMPHSKAPITSNASTCVPDHSNSTSQAHPIYAPQPYAPFCPMPWPWPCWSCGYGYHATQIESSSAPNASFYHYPVQATYINGSMTPPHTTSGVPCVTPAKDDTVPTNGIIYNVTDQDVLCGRGAPTNQHPGNQYFRDIISQFQLPYTAARRSRKPEIALRVVRIIEENGGRFLKRNKYCSRGGHFGWEEVGAQRAYEKACQALRDGAPEMRQHLEVKDFDNISIDESIDCDSLISDL